MDKIKTTSDLLEFFEKNIKKLLYIYEYGKNKGSKQWKKDCNSLFRLLAWTGNYKLLKKVIENGIEEYLDSNSINESLLYACFNQDIKTVKLLIKLGADVNYSDRGTTPLHDLFLSTPRFNDKINKTIYDITKILLDNGANPNLLDDEGISAVSYLFTPIQNSYTTKIVKMLINKNIDLNLNCDFNEPIICRLADKYSYRLFIDIAAHIYDNKLKVDWLAKNNMDWLAKNNCEFPIFYIGIGDTVLACFIAKYIYNNSKQIVWKNMFNFIFKTSTLSYSEIKKVIDDEDLINLKTGIYEREYLTTVEKGIFTKTLIKTAKSLGRYDL